MRVLDVLSLARAASDPEGEEGALYFNTTTGKVRVHDGTAWSDLGGVGGAVTSWVARHTPAFAVTTRFDLGRVGQAAAVMVDAARQALRIEQKPAVAISLFGMTGQAVSPQKLVAFAQTARISDFKDQDTPAFDLVQASYSLVRRVGGDVAANVTGAWTNLANAQDRADAASATSAGAVTAGSRKLRLDYPNQVGKGDLTITAVRLHLFGAVTGDPTSLLSTTVVSFNAGAGEQTLETILGEFANLGTPRTYDLFALGVDSWAEIDALQTFLSHAFGTASATVSCAVDAIEVEVVASRTDAL